MIEGLIIQYQKLINEVEQRNTLSKNSVNLEPILQNPTVQAILTELTPILSRMPIDLSAPGAETTIRKIVEEAVSRINATRAGPEEIKLTPEILKTVTTELQNRQQIAQVPQSSAPKPAFHSTFVNAIFSVFTTLDRWYDSFFQDFLERYTTITESISVY